MTLRTIALLTVLMAVAGVAAWRTTHPDSTPALTAALRGDGVVTIADPASGMAGVRLEFDESALRGRRQLLLAFADAVPHPESIRDLTADLDGRVVAVRTEVLPTALVAVIPVTSGATRLTVSYSIDPTFFPAAVDRSDPGDARSRITGDLAIVRSTSLLPRFDSPGATLGVRFALPAEWTAVCPWPTADGRVVVPSDFAASVEYLAFGPLTTSDLAAGAATVRVASPVTLNRPSFSIEAILQREIELVGAPLKRGGLFIATVVPHAFMHGGAAGERTIVQAPAADVLAHEVFHWWNSSRLTAADASWFREGLTEYYGIKIAREAGAWTDLQADACLADLNGEMRAIESAGSRALREASLDPAASRLVYAKGAIFWLSAERELHRTGRFLEEAVRRVVTSDREGLTTDDLRALFSGVYDGALDEMFQRFVIGADRLPDLELPRATGRSGCAREVVAR